MTTVISDRSTIGAHPWVIIGCGYTGTRLGQRLAAAVAPLYLTRRSAADADAAAALLGGHSRALNLDDLAQDEQAAAELAAWLPRGAVVVHTAPPGDSSPASERALVRCAHAAGARRIVYLSSTGVYPTGDGSWIDEDAPATPESEHGRARLAAESALLGEAERLAVSAVALRASGIYGPGRGVHARLLAGNYRIIGSGDTYVNRIHVDDLVQVIMAAALIPTLPRTVYNVADDEPVSSRAHAGAVADILGLPHPPALPESEAPPRLLAMLGANRRIRNQRLQSELGVILDYPTWREGLRQIMAEEGILPRAATRSPSP